MPHPTTLPWLGHAIEIGAILLFGWCWMRAPTERHDLRTDLLLATIYGWLLEALDLRIFGTYHYERATWWWIGAVPLYIPLLWSVIVHASMALSDRAALPEWARPWLDGLLAVLIDVAIDAIAIRVGLWRWQIPLTEGWFGVPAGNLCAWMWVAAWYSGVTRFVRHRVWHRREPRWHRGLIPLVAYTGLFGSLYTIGLAMRLLAIETPNERLWAFAAHVAGFSGLVASAHGRAQVLAQRRVLPMSLMASRWAIHGSFACVLWASGAWKTAPLLIIVSGGSLVAEWWAQRWCQRAVSH